MAPVIFLFIQFVKNGQSVTDYRTQSQAFLPKFFPINLLNGQNWGAK